MPVIRDDLNPESVSQSGSTASPNAVRDGIFHRTRQVLDHHFFSRASMASRVTGGDLGGRLNIPVFAREFMPGKQAAHSQGILSDIALANAQVQWGPAGGPPQVAWDRCLSDDLRLAF